MPHAELKYSADLALDAPKILAEVEALIGRHDSGAGLCKGRAYPAQAFHHTHAILTVSLLPKAHRDAGFRKALVADLVALIDRHLPEGIERSVDLSFTSDGYRTGKSGA